MAEKRMFTKKITDDDNFISLSSSAQALYFHLNQGADDDGFNNQISTAMFKAHASEDDLKVLIAKNFITRFDSGVIAVTHWRMHNALRRDRYTPTSHRDELSLLEVKENGTYVLGCQTVAAWLPDGCHSIDKSSIDKSRVEKDRIGEDSVGKEDNQPCPDLEFSTIHDVVKLTEEQITELIDTMGINSFNVYSKKLADYICSKNAHVNNCYKTILKWWTEDKAFA